MNVVQVMEKKAEPPVSADALVYCPMCTHTVPGRVTTVRNAAGRKVPVVLAGQRCARCTSPLDAAVVVRIQEAA